MAEARAPLTASIGIFRDARVFQANDKVRVPPIHAVGARVGAQHLEAEEEDASWKRHEQGGRGDLKSKTRHSLGAISI